MSRRSVVIVSVQACTTDGPFQGFNSEKPITAENILTRAIQLLGPLDESASVSLSRMETCSTGL